jgi:glycosyltransferase involved in cell wall biosynthesis
LTELPEDQYEIRFWYSSSSLDDFATKLSLQSARVDACLSLIGRILRKLSFFLYLLFNNEYFKVYSECDALMLAVCRWKPDICISLEQMYNPLSKIARVIGPIHDLMHRYEPSFPEVSAGGIYESRELLFSRHARYAAAVLVDSPIGKKHVLESYNVAEQKVHILPFIPNPLLEGEGKRPKSIPEKFSQFVFYPAQFWSHKNHVSIIKAISLLPKSLKMHCVFVGTTDKSGYEDVVCAMEQFKVSERVHILGYVSDEEIVWLYKNAFALVMPTFFGPTNIPPLEAFQYGCPVIASNVYGMPDQLGEAALFIDPRSPFQIAKSICLLAEDSALRSRLIANGYSQVAKWTKQDFKNTFLNVLYQVQKLNFYQ